MLSKWKGRHCPFHFRRSRKGAHFSFSGIYEEEAKHDLTVSNKHKAGDLRPCFLKRSLYWSVFLVFGKLDLYGGMI